MRTITSGLDLTQAEDTLIVTLVADLPEADYQRFELEAAEALNRLRDPSLRNVVVDLGATDDFGSAALRFFVQLGQMVRDHRGRMALCHASAHEVEVLRGAHLDGLWPICGSRAEALWAVAH
jgi:anti-anti-sigma factor